MTECDVRGAGLDYSDAQPLYFNLFSEPRTPRRMFENIGLGLQADACNRGAAAEADASGEHALRQQLKWAQLGSSSWKWMKTESSS